MQELSGKISDRIRSGQIDARHTTSHDNREPTAPLNTPHTGDRPTGRNR